MKVKNLPRTLVEILIEFSADNNIIIYIFGSILYSVDPNDIDCLIVYKHDEFNIREVILIKESLYKILKSETDLDPDIIMLSLAEMNESSFIEFNQYFHVKLEGK